MQFRGLTVGVPYEIMDGERRAALTPDTAQKLIGQGARVVVESGAGRGAFLADGDYRKVGAEIAPDAEGVYREADIVLKVKEPRFHSGAGRHEAEMIRPEGALICFLHPANPSNHGVVRTLASRGVTSLTLDGIPRISRAQQMDALTSMSTIAGYRAVISAANHFRRFVPMIPVPTGTVGPATFLVVGCGVAGLQAIGTARRLGARVRGVDIRPEAVEQAKSLGAEVIELDVPSELAVSEEGYARRLPEEWYAREREALKPHLRECDVLILTALIMGERAPLLVTGEMVEKMRDGSVAVDIAIDQGGNCELTRAGEEYLHGEVMVSGLLNIPSSLAPDATSMLSRNILNFLTHVVSEGQLRTDADDPILRGTLVTAGGEVVHRGTLRAMEDAG